MPYDFLVAAGVVSVTRPYIWLELQTELLMVPRGDVLVRVDDGGEIEVVGLDSILQNRQDPTQISVLGDSSLHGGGAQEATKNTHSGGLAGSIIAASFVFSSTTR